MIYCLLCQCIYVLLLILCHLLLILYNCKYLYMLTVFFLTWHVSVCTLLANICCEFFICVLPPEKYVTTSLFTCPSNQTGVLCSFDFVCFCTSLVEMLLKWHKRVYDDRLNGWQQCPAGDPVCRDPPARGHHTGFICGGFPSPLGSCRREVRF